MMRHTIYIILFAATILIVGSCKGKYDDIVIDSEDVARYVNLCTKFDTDNKDFLLYASNHSSMGDSTEIKDYKGVMQSLYENGFPDVDYFIYVHKKLNKVIEVIRKHPEKEIERYPGIGTADFSFLEEGEKQFQQYLEDNTISSSDKEFYRQQMAQIETTKLDLFDKQEKNKIWVELVRKESKLDKMVQLSDVDIMLLTRFERDISGM